ncbi:MAG: aldo/keto reductase [Actinomycetota bacterium]|nr:MAG: aldo/keto reductase [Actinomycetota bacterium]
MSSSTDDAAVAAAGTVRIGSSVTVNRLGFGAMNLTGPGVWGPPEDRQAAIDLVRRAVDLGVNFIDTADAYGPFVSEEILCEALHPYGGVLVATKGGLTRPGPGRALPVGRPEYLRQCVEMSLRRLRVERIELYQLHRIDPLVPVADQIGELAQLQAEGKIGQLGLSAVTVEELQHVQTMADIVSVQNRHNVVDRGSQALLDHCTATGIAFISYSPMAIGRLAESEGPLQATALRLGVTPSQVALAWLLRQSPVVVPIPGTRSVTHLEENCRAAAIELDEEANAALSALAG